MRTDLIRAEVTRSEPQVEPEEGKPERTGQDWLGRGRSEKRKLWEKLNPRHRKQMRLLAETLALEQTRARLPEEMQARLASWFGELERLAARASKLLAEVARRTRPRG